MKKWFIAGGIASALVVGVAVLGIVAISFLPSSVNLRKPTEWP